MTQKHKFDFAMLDMLNNRFQHAILRTDDELIESQIYFLWEQVRRELRPYWKEYKDSRVDNTAMSATYGW